MTLLSILLLLLFIVPTSSQTTAWERIIGSDDATSYFPRADSSSAVVEDVAYLFGGSRFANDSMIYLDDFYRFVPDDDGFFRFVQLESGPSARAGAVMMANNDFVLVVGGGTDDALATDVAWLYDIANNTWTELEDSPVTPRLNAVGFVLDGKAYILGGGIFGGNSNSNILPLSDLYEYDFAENTWRAVSSDFRPRYNAQAVVDDDNVYVYGGYGQNVQQQSLIEYTNATASWQTTKLNPVIAPTQSLAGFASVSEDRLFLFGGAVPGSSECGPLNPTTDIYFFDTRTKTWSKYLLSGAQPRASLDFEGVYFSNSDYFYVIGGYEYDCETNERVYDLEGGYRIQITPRIEVDTPAPAPEDLPEVEVRPATSASTKIPMVVSVMLLLCSSVAAVAV